MLNLRNLLIRDSLKSLKSPDPTSLGTNWAQIGFGLSLSDLPGIELAPFGSIVPENQ